MSNKKVTPRGSYPHTKRVGDFIYVSGTSSRQSNNEILGVHQIDEMGTKILDIKQQTQAVFDKIKENLQNENADLSDIIDVTTFLVNMNDFAGYNKVYAQLFSPENGPTRTTVAVHQLPHPDLVIEVKVVAYKPIKTT